MFPLAGQQSPPLQIRVDVDLVLVNVTVTDSRSRFVEGMRREHFRIWEDKVEQDIVTFSNEDAPVSLGIILDRSGSMGEKKIPSNASPQYRDKFEEMRTTAFSCLKGGIRDDEYFLIEFSNSPQVVADFTNDMSKLREKLLFSGPGGFTALWDAIYLGAAQVEKGTHPRKALLVLTDGLENNSRYTLSQLKNVLREQDVRIYSYGGGNVTFDGLNSLTSITGGRTFMGSNPCKELEAELRTQYVIGYRPTNRTKDGEFRRITVRIKSEGLPKNISGLTVRARQGYFATP
jgi:Ca-activated chloride channel family protein